MVITMVDDDNVAEEDLFGGMQGLETSSNTQEIVKSISKDRKVGVKRVRGSSVVLITDSGKNIQKKRWRKFDTIKKDLFVVGQVDLSLQPLVEVKVAKFVDDALLGQNNDVRAFSGKFVKLFVETDYPTEEQMDKMLNETMGVCSSSRSISVCGDLLGVADLALFTNDEIYNAGKWTYFKDMPDKDKRIFILKRNKLQKLINELRDSVVAELNTFTNF
jgi:hypothetical protein